MHDGFLTALSIVAGEATRLREGYRLDWPARVEQAVFTLKLHVAEPKRPALCAIVGGASSGKSTIFNNLLDRRHVSRVTARGHATRGLIVAVHEDHRQTLRGWLSQGRIFTGLPSVTCELDESCEGEPNRLTVAHHAMAPLREVILADTPDFTSEAAYQEGDVLLSLLPWFDRLIVVVDRERWFDRQAVSEFRAQSVPLGQRRLVVFNCTQEGELTEDDRQALAGQAERLSATDSVVLEYRVGRGLCTFPPGAMDGLRAFVQLPPEPRRAALSRVVGQSAGAALNQNDERRNRLAELEGALERVIENALPSAHECLTSLMTREEREHLEIVARVLRLREWGSWLSSQAQRLESALRKVPLLGTLVGSPAAARPARAEGPPRDREAIGRAFFESCATRAAHDMHRTVRGCRFWDEVERWTGLEPAPIAFAWSPNLNELLRADTVAFDRAMEAWNRRVAEECKGFTPTVSGALSASVLGLTVVLVLVPGPIVALTLPAAAAAIAAHSATLATGAGVGAVFGRHFTRLMHVVREKLTGSDELVAVQNAAAKLRTRVEEWSMQAAHDARQEARRLVLPEGDPLEAALETLRRAGEEA
jgi:hypothetical protein